jgi:hypothetical protein
MLTDPGLSMVTDPHQPVEPGLLSVVELADLAAGIGVKLPQAHIKVSDDGRNWAGC